MSAKGEMWAKCKPCDYAWRIAFLPMELFALAELMKGARCPKCGAGKLLVANTSDIEKAKA
jgi:rubredoxin